jgi:hypothetical protein
MSGAIAKSASTISRARMLRNGWFRRARFEELARPSDIPRVQTFQLTDPGFFS